MATLFKFQNGELADADQVNTTLQTINNSNSFGKTLSTNTQYIGYTDGYSNHWLHQIGHTYLNNNSNEYRIRDGVTILPLGSSSIKTTSASVALDFAPIYDDFRAGSFPLTIKAGSYAPAASNTSTTVSMSNSYGSCIQVYTTAAGGGGWKTGMGSVIFNGTTPLLIKPGSSIELGVEAIFEGAASPGGDQADTYGQLELREKTTGSTVSLFNYSNSANYSAGITNTSSSGNNRVLTKLIYNSTTGSYLIRNLYQTSHNYTNYHSDTTYVNSDGGWYASESSGVLFTGSWYLAASVYAHTYGTASSHSTIYLTRITKFTGTESGSEYVVLGPYTLKDNFGVILGNKIGYSQVPGSLTLYYGRDGNTWETTANNTRMSTSTGSTIYIKAVGTYTGSLDTTCWNTPFLTGAVITYDGERNKW